MNKYKYLYVLQGNYGYGYDDLLESEDFREIRQDLKCYRDNEIGVNHRIIKRRELNQ